MQLYRNGPQELKLFSTTNPQRYPARKQFFSLTITKKLACKQLYLTGLKYTELKHVKKAKRGKQT